MYLKIFVLGLLCLIRMEMNSTNIFWIGSSNDWSDKDNWSLTSGGVSCSCIPSALDDVFMENGIGVDNILIKDGFHAFARSIIIGTSKNLFIGAADPSIARLDVNSNGVLDTALIINGKITTRDSLTVYGAAQTNIHIDQAGELVIKPTGKLILDGTNFTVGIESAGMMEFEGDHQAKSEVKIMNAKEFGIKDYGLTHNNGILHITHIVSENSSIRSYGIQINGSGTWLNDILGEIHIDSLNMLLQTSIGLDMSGSFHNKGRICISNLRGTCLAINANDTLINEGHIELKDFSQVGLDLGGRLENSDSVLVFQSNNTGYTQQSGVDVSNWMDQFVENLYNDLNGIIHIYNLTSLEGMTNGNRISNFGKIIIEDISGEPFSQTIFSAKFYSEGELIITNNTDDFFSANRNFEIVLGSTMEISN